MTNNGHSRIEHNAGITNMVERRRTEEEIVQLNRDIRELEYENFVISKYVLHEI